MQKKALLAVIIGFLIGALWLVALRFFTYQSDTIHYHANFALYINGEQDKFDNFTFYEEVQSCGSDEVNNPKTRVHLHGNVPSVIHVHAPGVTWGHFFANLGYGLGDNFVKTDKAVYVDGVDGNKLTFWLNGEEVDNVANQTISSEDTLLINYGKDDDMVLKQRFDAIPTDAGDYNEKNDPASCAGTKPATLWERLKQSVL
jgi:hypothetical protein